MTALLYALVTLAKLVVMASVFSIITGIVVGAGFCACVLVLAAFLKQIDPRNQKL